MLNFSKEHVFRWFDNLKQSKMLFNNQNYYDYYYGYPEKEPFYPGMKILLAYYAFESYEMEKRLEFLAKSLNIKDDSFYFQYCEMFFKMYLEDFKSLAYSVSMFDEDVIDNLIDIANDDLLIEDNWSEQINNLQCQIEKLLILNVSYQHLNEKCLLFCVKFILNAAKSIIKQAVRAALYVKENDELSLNEAILPTLNDYGISINRIFYNTIMPLCGFNDLNEIISLTKNGVLSTKRTLPSYTVKENEITYKHNYFSSCHLFSIFNTIAKHLMLEKNILTQAYCPYCVSHYKKTMDFIIPSDLTITYYLKEGLGYGSDKCVFILESILKEDEQRCMEAADLIFQELELTLNR